MAPTKLLQILFESRRVRYNYKCKFYLAAAESAGLKRYLEASTVQLATFLASKSEQLSY